ncbi:hypothetical protein [Pontibacter vulgaris]|uniref:hypothetical protein n=1 Tax=Pontibacter vulgaris TaxID=2905679 RepID=UPI001FA6F9AF|nr:hypothetical protein [Pontibacter vulgaris]
MKYYTKAKTVITWQSWRCRDRVGDESNLDDLIVQVKKFSIYKPDSFYWTRTYKSYAFILAVILLVLILKYLVNVPESHPTFIALFFAPILPFVYRIALSLTIRNAYKPLKGKLEGHIIFSKDAIIIADKIYPLDVIWNIEFEGRDWLGNERWTRGLREKFEDPFSQGVDNTLVLFLKDKQIIRTRFQRLDEYEFREIEGVILDYYLKDIISYLQTVQVLCLSTQQEWNRLKELKLK